MTEANEQTNSNPMKAFLNSPDMERITKRFRDLEKRWGKGFEEVLIDIHDHIFGATTQAHLDAADARDKAAAEAAKKAAEEAAKKEESESKS